ncbi:MAG: hypothetical protein KDG56_15795 [Ottowia sp.]|nr:hypothetical protein [Ottowia sp.]
MDVVIAGRLCQRGLDRVEHRNCYFAFAAPKRIAHLRCQALGTHDRAGDGRPDALSGRYRRTHCLQLHGDMKPVNDSRRHAWRNFCHDRPCMPRAPSLTTSTSVRRVIPLWAKEGLQNPGSSLLARA